MSLDNASDPAYPTVTASDPVFSCQTREPLVPPLTEIATPGMWARLAGPLQHALVEIWTRLGLRRHGQPTLWVSLNYGRIAINAHGWERMSAALAGRTPDPALLEPVRGFGRLLEHWESQRVVWRRRRLERRFDEAVRRRDESLRRAGLQELAELDAGSLARGPLDDRHWMEILLPALRPPLETGQAHALDGAVQAGLELEQRYAAELGRRLVLRGAIKRPAQVAYLTVTERIQAVHETAVGWSDVAEERASRVKRFAEVEVPPVFWGRPRIDGEVGEDLGYNTQA